MWALSCATFSGLPGLLWRPGGQKRVHLQEVVRQNRGHIEHVLHKEQFSSLWGLILYQISNVFVIIKMCYVHNQWYDISCATLYILKNWTLLRPVKQYKMCKASFVVTSKIQKAKRGSHLSIYILRLYWKFMFFSLLGWALIPFCKSRPL